MDKNIIWVTYRGRHIPIKPGMKGKFKKKKVDKELSKKQTEDDEYKLYKQAKEKPDSIDAMTENSTDWEALDKKYSEKYNTENNKKEISNNKYIDNYNDKTYNEWLAKQVANKQISEQDYYKMLKVQDKYKEELKTQKTATKDDIKEDYNNTEKGKKDKLLNNRYKEEEKKLNNIEDKIKEINSKDETYIKYDDREIKITGLNTDYNNKKNIELVKKEKEQRNKLNEISKTMRYYGTRERLSLSEYEQYYISLGYSKATALKYAKEEIAKRKRK